MAEKPWYVCVDQLRPYVAKVSTPRGHGTGFLFTYAGNNTLCVLATAAHVVGDAAAWEEPVRIEQLSNGRTVFLRPAERAILRREEHDTAAILFPTQDNLFPKDPLTLIDEEKAVRVGVDIGWLGFPAVAPESLCFFLGRASALLEPQRTYLVDGVAINGVSGGPAFSRYADGSIVLVGIVSAYLPNLSASGALPGLCVVRHVGALHDIVRQLASLEEAKKKEQETALTEPSPNGATPPESGA